MKIAAFLRSLALFLAGFFSGSAAAQPASGAACSTPAESMLWEVRGADLDGRGVSLHLFGSIHVGKADFYPLHPAVETRFRDADNLVFEVDPQVMSDPLVALQMQQRGMLPEGQTLADLVSPEALAKLESAMKEFGMPLGMFMRAKPWLLTLMLTNLQINALGYNAQYGLESYFIGQKSPRSQVRELESLQQQLDMLDSLDPKVFLDYSLEEYDSGTADMENMISAWKCGDKAALSETLFASMRAAESANPQKRAALEGLNDKLFTERNLTMANGIENFVRSGGGSWFVVVGSGHLLGEDSVVDLLQQRGYRVTPVKLDP